MKYKKGDTVHIQSKEWFDVQEKDDDGEILRDEFVFFPWMLEYAGRTAKITSAGNGNSYLLDIDGGSTFWAEWMFSPDKE